MTNAIIANAIDGRIINSISKVSRLVNEIISHGDA